MIYNFPSFGISNLKKFPYSTYLQNNKNYPRNIINNENSYMKDNLSNTVNKEQKNSLKTINLKENSKYIDKKNNNSYGNKAFEQNRKKETSDFLEIFGLKLHFDDILLICLIFFLYKEDVKDPYLFIILILLLLS